MRASGASIICMCLLSAGPASAQEAVAVLPTDLGGGRIETADLSAALLQQGVALAPPRRTGDRIEARYGRASGLSSAEVAAMAEQGEAAYFEMRYDDAVQALSSSAWSAAERAVADMAADPALAVAVRQGMMARARAQIYSDRSEAGNATLRNVVRLFPAWIPRADQFQPDVTERYTSIRDGVLQGARTLTVHTPDEACAVSLNGEPVGEGRQASVPVVDGEYAVRVSCNNQVSRIHLMGVPQTTMVVVDPSFDQRFDPSAVSLVPAGDAADDLSRLAAWGRAFADVSGSGRVVLAGLTAADALQLVLIDTGAGSVVAVRCDRIDGAHPVDAAVTALFGGEAGPHVTVARDGSWQRDPEDGDSFAPWVAFGVGGVGLVLGVVFLVVEGGAFSDYEDCRGDAECATSGELSDLQSDSETAGVVATVGFGMAAVGAIVGAILLLLEDGGEGSSAGDSATVSWVPEIRSGVGPAGGVLGFIWQF